MGPATASSAPRVCVFGSANMDLVVLVDRAPAAGETVTGSRLVTVPGGKGANQALAAARAGADVRMLGAVGADEFGARIRDVLARDGVDTSGLRTADVPTGTAHIILDRAGENSIVVVPGANGTVTDVSAEHRSAIAAADLLLLQLELPLSAVVAAATYGRSAGARVVLTPAPVVPLPADLLGVVDVLVANEHETAAITGTTDLERAADALLARVPLVIVTLGGRGCLLATRGGERHHVPGRSVPVVDTTAAGDTFVGALAVGLGLGRAPLPAAQWATAAAALAVQREGASPSMPHRDEIDRFAGAVEA